ncbi:MAG: hypothetical protein NC237_03150 [Eubacterium sp.]|nr:hypothetical protein [Eubacterium sp.]MCM1419128.1 hypothetical protein [Roseburia sp.]
MKKAYSKRAGAEVFALAPEQLAVFQQSGYEVSTPEEVIADAGAVKLTPPERKRAYVVFNFKTGVFAVRVKTCTLQNGKETGELVGEIVQAGILKRLAENADPDRPKAEPSAAGAAGPFASLLTEALKKSFAGMTPATPAPAPAEGEEVSE